MIPERFDFWARRNDWAQLEMLDHIDGLTSRECPTSEEACQVLLNARTAIDLVLRLAEEGCTREVYEGIRNDWPEFREADLVEELRERRHAGLADAVGEWLEHGQYLRHLMDAGLQGDAGMIRTEYL